MDMSPQSIQLTHPLVKENPLIREIAANEGSSTTTPGFGDIMKQVLGHVNGLQQDASSRMTAVETGQSSDLLGAMIASQKSSLSFQSLMQVRNKVVTAYEEVMRMQV